MATDTSVICQAVVESGRVTYCAIVKKTDGYIETRPFSGMELHSTTSFNGVAVIVPEGSEISLPETIHAYECREILPALAERIPTSDGSREVIFIPFA